MKKFVIILLVACLVLGCGIGYFSAKGRAAASGEPVALYDPENVAPETELAAPETEDAFAPDTRRIDFDALRERYPLDAVVGSCEGGDVTWDEMYYWLRDMGSQAQSYIDTMAMYGQAMSWDEKLSAESEQTFAEYTVEVAKDCICQLRSVEALCAENGITLTAEDEAAIAEELRQVIDSTCGEGASEEDFNAYLAENHESRAMFDRLGRINYLYQNLYNKLYGKDAGDVAEADALAYLEDGGYLCAGHILFMTVDPDTREPLDEDAIAEKLALAEAVSEELRAIEDDEARLARFLELKEQYCEDPGKVDFPDGYLFAPGRMVTEFEDAAGGLKEYEVSEPVLSPHGYHVIMRLPLSVEMTMHLPESGTAANARSAYAGAQFGALVTARIEACELTLNDEMSQFKLTDYLKAAE